MVKRVAEEQITKDELSEGDHFDPPVVASAEVLAKRRILQPKGKQLQFRPISTGSFSPVNSSQTCYKEKVLALNKQFSLSVSKAIDNGVLDLGPLLTRYSEYFNKIESVELKRPSTQNLKSGSQANCDIRESDTVSSKEAISRGSHETEASPSTNDDKGASLISTDEVNHGTNESNKLNQSSENPIQMQNSEIQDIDEVTFQPVASLPNKLDSVVTGEEHETTLFSVRCKVLSLDPQNQDEPYKNVGLGELKVLKGDNKKSRILVRAEGSQRVLLDSFLLPQVSYSTVGKGMSVRVPATSSDGSLVTYIIRVKDRTLAEELRDLLNNEK